MCFWPQKSEHRVKEPSDNLRIDGVILLYAIEWMRLSLLDHLLCVIEEEHAEQRQASVDSNRVQACAKDRGGRQEHGPWDGRREDGENWSCHLQPHSWFHNSTELGNTNQEKRQRPPRSRQPTGRPCWGTSRWEHTWPQWTGLPRCLQCTRPPGSSAGRPAEWGEQWRHPSHLQQETQFPVLHCSLWN